MYQGILYKSGLVGAAEGAAIGAIQGAVTGAVIGAVTEGIKTKSWEGAWKGALSGAVNGAADGFMFGAIGGAISGAMNPRFCFAAGTLVMTKQGLKAIEEITVGEEVLAYNSNLGIYEYKDVVDTYVNKTKQLCHIETDNDEIICTPNHSILTSNGWKEAKDVTEKDSLITKEKMTKVKKVSFEDLNEESNVYNLNVLGYHTYVIGKDLVVVHNSCHGNDLNCEKENKLYYLVDENDNIMKIGETTRGYKRYTKKFLMENDVKMRFIKSGSKREIHNLQHQELLDFFTKNGILPKLNKTFW